MFIRRNFLSENLYISNEFTTFAVQLGNKTNGLTNKIQKICYVTKVKFWKCMVKK